MLYSTITHIIKENKDDCMLIDLLEMGYSINNCAAIMGKSPVKLYDRMLLIEYEIITEFGRHADDFD